MNSTLNSAQHSILIAQQSRLPRSSKTPRPLASVHGLLLPARSLVSAVFTSVSSSSPCNTLVANLSSPAAGFSTAIAAVTKLGFPKSGTDRRIKALEQERYVVRGALYFAQQKSQSDRQGYYAQRHGTHKVINPKITAACVTATVADG